MKEKEDLNFVENPVTEPEPKKKKKGSKKQPDSRKEKTKYFVRASYFFVCMFLSLCAYLVYFNVEKRDSINNNVYNTKQESKDSMIVRGRIYSSDGEVLAGTNVADDGTETRVYPYEDVFAHVVGYSTNGRSGAEAAYNTELTDCNASIFEQIKNEAQNVKIQGDSVVLTLDSKLQRACYDALGAYRGAIVVLEPSTGRVLAMVSKPDFNPNTLSSDWEYLNADGSGSPLLNRATQGLYPPGSTFKVLTTLAYIRENPSNYLNYTFNCQGAVSQDDVTITCYNGSVHGTETLEQAFMSSCNGAFSTIGTQLDNSDFTDICEDFLFNQDIPINMSSAKSLFPLPENASYGEEMTTAIGQGDTVATPLQMAIVAAAVANGGTIMTPYYVDRIETYDQKEVKSFLPTVYRKVMSAEEADIIGQFMINTVQNGTARALSGQSYTAAGKTGSAEYDTSSGTIGTHSWFIGYTNVDDPELAIAVIAEDGGSGSSTAVPIAKQVFDAYYQGWYS